MVDTCNNFGSSCKKVTIRDFGLLSGDWYLLDITPLPTPEDITSVVSDIVSGDIIAFNDGKLIHNDTCVKTSHELLSELEDVLRSLKPTNFKFAVFDNRTKMLHGQPICFSISPKIDFINFPDHPHINAPSIPNKIPSSICYSSDPNNLGKFTEGDRILDTLLLISEWAFRQQIWSATRKKNGKGIWIGPQSKTEITSKNYLELIDPKGRCHCGKQKKYYDCCYHADLEVLNGVTIPKFNKKGLIETENGVFKKIKSYFD